ncbi:carboxypeptidase M32 [Flavilitoribacter nigricans]|uniref:Metal-dependent carboxypeptidase n=1 Tax=Flavilitoribacter nigricans (strain ATCC 23147 / DSM 23189 / NBRC 102662 / NCIMB 1420 / SS-2) TaxID=1122177 RepID=A0A2D0N962_FLAN2|nr:carboxypeptidase M32 [Flavilitoribacter nigricans]PHN05017.1 carboxypeptidase [Flavilitoribacter nigricans DSM 23189 = NBRC 102662]
MQKNNELYDKYVRQMQKLADVEYAIGVLSWDKEVSLPPQGARFRSQQVATLSGMAHEIFTAPELGEVIEKLVNDGQELSISQQRNIELSWRDLQRSRKLDMDFVIRRSQLVSAGYHAWIAAREANDFKVFAQPLADLIEIKREEARKMGYEAHPYDALMEEFEPGMRVSQLDPLFVDVREQLVDFVRLIREQPQVNDAFLHQHFPQQQQWDYGLELLKRIGFSFQAGRQDLSTHPFTINFSPEDVRVTTRVDENNFATMTWSCLHEGGHALYEQGLPVEYYGLPLGRYVSLGIHESQSRLWENNVGRSLAFWEAQFPDLQAVFPQQFSGVTPTDFFRAINKIEPSLIRVESDELHYHFHILIRYELEKALIEGSLEVADLRDAWNEKYKAYLDLEVPDDKRGILQDIHWAHGSLGYFPTYSLGSFYAAQLYHQIDQDLPDLQESILRGDTSPVLEWLRKNIHAHGRFYSANDLCEKVCGEPLQFRYFMEYARKKYNSIYDLGL